MGILLLILIVGGIYFWNTSEEFASWCKKGLGCLTIGVFLLFAVSYVVSCVSDLGKTYQDYRDKRAQEVAEKEELGRLAAAEKDAIRRREEAEARAKAERARQAREAAQREAAKEEKLRNFALKEASVLWEAYQNLQAAIVSQNEKIEDLRKTLTEFGMSPDSDSDFQRICSLRDEMVGSLKTMHTKIEDAYLASRKYEATPSKKEYAELRRKLLEDGLQEAEAAERRFKEMRNTK